MLNIPRLATKISFMPGEAWNAARAGIVSITPLAGVNVRTVETPAGTVIHGDAGIWNILDVPAPPPLPSGSDDDWLDDPSDAGSNGGSDAGSDPGSDPGSDGGSGSSDSDSSSSGSGSDSDSFTSKTAIVELPDGRFIGWFFREADRPRFSVTMEVPLGSDGRADVALPAELLASCDPETLAAWHPFPVEAPALVAAEIAGGRLIVAAVAPGRRRRPKTVRVRVGGVPRGCDLRPWLEFTVDQAAANARFYHQALAPIL